MKNNLGAPGDFAMAYVITHELGHHVLILLGISNQVHYKRTQVLNAVKAIEDDRLQKNLKDMWYDMH
jgi:predicted metalloprotease